MINTMSPWRIFWLSEFSAIRYSCLLPRLWLQWWRASWLAITFFIVAIAFIADQINLWGGYYNNSVKASEIAARLFPFERDIALAPAYYYTVFPNVQNPIALQTIKDGIEFDPLAVDLIIGKMTYEVFLNKTKDAIETHKQLCKIVPRIEVCKT